MSTDDSGNSVHTLVGPAVKDFKPRGDSSKRSNIKRTLQGANNIGCGGTDFSGSPGTTNDAVAALKFQCNGGPTGGGLVRPGKDFYSVGGKMVAYFCNFSTMDNNCYGDEVDDAIANRITARCGSYQSGWDLIPDRAAQYGYEDISAKFCGRGRNGCK